MIILERAQKRMKHDVEAGAAEAKWVAQMYNAGAPLQNGIYTEAVNKGLPDLPYKRHPHLKSCSLATADQKFSSGEWGGGSKYKIDLQVSQFAQERIALQQNALASWPEWYANQQTAQMVVTQAIGALGSLSGVEFLDVLFDEKILEFVYAQCTEAQS
jgi:hypothetical protein